MVFWEIKLEVDLYEILKQTGNLQTREARNVARNIFHLAGQFLVHSPRRFVHRGTHQVLQHFLILARKNFRLNANLHNLLLAVHFYVNHAAARGSFYVYGIDLPLQVVLQLPELRKHLLESVDFHQLHSPCARRTSEIFPPKRCSIERTIGSRSNLARNSCCSEPARVAASGLVLAASLAHTRIARPSTLLEMPRSFSKESRPSSISAKDFFSVGKESFSSAPASSQTVACSSNSPRNFCCCCTTTFI